MNPIHLLTCLLFVITQATLPASIPTRTRKLLVEGKEPVRIACIGDSITGVYYHSGGVRAYPEMLEIALRRLYPTVHNAGISGDTSKGGLARLDRDVLVHQPHLVTVMFGMNDLVRTPAAEFKKTMLEIIRRCRTAGAEVVLCTQNSIVDSQARPVGKLAEYTATIRELVQTESLGLADCYEAFEAVHARDPLEWSLLLSDPIHPNMDGHKLFAETISKTITGKEVSLADVAAPEHAIPHTLHLLNEGKPVQVLAMPPYDQHVETALKTLYPSALITVKSWPIEGQSLAELETAAKAVRTTKPDLVIIAVPASASEARPQDFHRHYAWIMNWSLSFGRQEWDVVVALPSIAKPDLTSAERDHEVFARRLIRAQDLNMIERQKGDSTSLRDLLAQWFAAQKRS